MSAQPKTGQSADLEGAIVDSIKLVAVEHAIRVAFQEKTRCASLRMIFNPGRTLGNQAPWYRKARPLTPR